MNGEIVWDHYKELQSEFPNVTLVFENDRFYVRGKIQFRAQYLDHKLVDEAYLVEMELPPNYPSAPPIARELEGRVPNTFHTFSDGTLCLGAPLAVKVTFAKNSTLVGFVKTQLIPYLYSFSYAATNKELPYGELDHGAMGILNYYKELLQIDSAECCIRFLYILASQKYRGHLLCPCNSGNILRKCHGPMLLNLQKYQTQREFGIELIDCLDFIKQNRRKG